MIACMAPPGVVFGHTATVEKAPWSRSNADALVLCALFNACAFDWLVRQKTATHLSLFILEAIPVPPLTQAARRFLAHGALRLSCAHAGFAMLWQEQVGTTQAFPAVRDLSARRALRAQMDAVVADAYALCPEQYGHILGSFNHRSHPDTALLCSAALAQLRRVGIEAFCCLYDPFACHPLVEKPASPAELACPSTLPPPGRQGVVA